MSTVKAANLQNTGSGAPTFQNSSGTEIGQLARAWVNFNGTGTPAIRDSFNVSSLTDQGQGDHQVNFTNAIGNANYCAQVSCGDPTDMDRFVIVHEVNTSYLRMRTFANSDALRDLEVNCATIFSD
jgi:hypothetical protein